MATAVLAGAFWSCTLTQDGARNEHYLDEAEAALLAGEHARAAGHYEAFAQDNPGDPRRSEALVQAGKCHLAVDRPDEALRDFDRAMASDPDRSLRLEIRFRRGVAHLMQGRTAPALDAFGQVAAAPAGERGTRILEDELNYEYALALFRAGDWASAQRRLAAVSDRGPYASRKRVRTGMTSFAVQVGAFSTELRARSHAARLKLRSRGTPSVRAVTGGDPLFIVTSGPFARYDDAQREADRLRTSGFPDAFVIP